MSEMFGAKRRDWESGPYLEQKRRVTQLYGEIAALGLESHIAELSMYGYTVVPPEKLAPPEYIARLRDAVLAISYRRSGVTPDVVNGSTHVGEKHPLGQFMRYVFFDDPVFEPMLTNPVLLGLVTYLVGDDAILSVHDAMVKGSAEIALPIHNDNGAKHTSVFPDQPNAATLNLLLTDYEEGSGPIAFLPGSHVFRREPTPAEMRGLVSEMVPVHAPAGSLVVWPANTWHMALPRRDPGLRITVLYHFCRGHLQAQQNFRDPATDEKIGGAHV